MTSPADSLNPLKDKLLSPLNMGWKEDSSVDHSRFQSLYDYEALSKYIPYQLYDPSTQIYYNDQSVGFVLEGVPFTGVGETTQRQLMGLFQYTLPKGSSIQFSLLGSGYIDPLLSRWKDLRHDAPPIFQRMVEERLRAFKTKRTVGSPFRNFRLIISVSLPYARFEKMGLKRFQEAKNQIISSFEGYGMPVHLMEPQELIESTHEFFGKMDKERSPYNPLDSLAGQVLPHGMKLRVEPDRLSVDDDSSFMESFTVKKFSTQWDLNAMDIMIGDSASQFLQITSPFMLHYGVFINDDGKISRTITKKQSVMDYQAGVPNLRKFIPSLDFQIAEWDFVRAKFEEGQRLIKTQFQVILMGEEKDRIQSEQNLLNLFRSQRWSLERDTYIQMPAVLGTLPMMWGEGAAKDSMFFEKAKTTLSYEPANLLPVIAEWKGTQTPAMMFVGRRGQIFHWHPFDNTAGNYNACVVGRSGSGKSVFMQELITSILGMGGRVTILDVGRSFEKTVKLLGGTYIEFSTDSSICINPFTSMPKGAGSREATQDALGMLKPIVALMAAPTGGTSDLENAYIEKAITQAWREKQHGATITDVAKQLLQFGKDEATRLGEMLYPYTKEGIYGRFFEGEANIDFSQKAVVVELEELKERKDLQAVVVQMIILQVTNQIYLGDRKTPSCLVLDEAWDMLRGEQSGAFIETAARRLRKYFGSLITGTQSVNDFYATPGAQAAFENSDWMCLLSQKKESIEQLKNSGRLSMEGGLEEQLRSVHTKQGQYAEVMISGPEGYSIGRLYLDTFTQMLFSTKANEYAAVKALEAQGYSLEEAITELVRRKEGRSESKKASSDYHSPIDHKKTA